MNTGLEEYTIMSERERGKRQRKNWVDLIHKDNDYLPFDGMILEIIIV